MLAHDQKRRLKRRAHHVAFYDRMVFYELMLLARVRNKNNFLWCSICGAAVGYGLPDSQASRRDSVFFGHSSTQRCFMENTKKFSELKTFWKNAKSAIKCELLHVGTFDNTQQSTTSKYQRGGKSSSFVKVTARMFLQVWNDGPSKSLIFNAGTVEIKHLDQATPSPAGMPPCELAGINYNAILDPSISETIAALPAGSSYDVVDYSGSRVNQCLKLISLSEEFIAQK